jgi:hypothetical protein
VRMGSRPTCETPTTARRGSSAMAARRPPLRGLSGGRQARLAMRRPPVAM